MRCAYSPRQSIRSLACCSALAAIVLVCRPCVSAEPTAFEGHGGIVYATMVADDGDQLVTGSFDNTIKIWDISSKAVTRTMIGHTGLVLTVAMSPDGNQLASGSLDKTIRIWDVPRREPLGVQGIAGGAIIAFDAATDGKTQVTLSRDGKLRIRRGDATTESDLGGIEVTGLSTRRDSQQFALVTAAGQIVLLDATGQVTHRWTAHKNEVSGAAYAPNSSFLLTSGKDGLVKKWDAKDSPTRSAPIAEKPTTGFALSNDAALAASVDEKTVRIWKTADASAVRQFEVEATEARHLTLSANKALIAFRDADQTVRVYAANDGSLKHTLPASDATITALRLSSNGQQVVIGDANGRVRVLTAADGNEVWTTAAHEGGLTGMTITPNGQQIVTCGADKTLKVWNAQNGEAIRQTAVEAAPTCVGIAGDGKLVAVGSDGGATTVFNLADGMQVATWKNAATPTSVALNVNGTQALLIDDAGLASVWDVKLQRMREGVLERDDKLRAGGFSRDSKALILSGEKSPLLVQPQRLQLVHVADEVAVHSLSLAANGAQHATGGHDGMIKLWNTSNGSPVRQYSGLPRPAERVSLSPNNQQVAGASGRELRVWNRNNGAAQLRIQLADQQAAVRFSLDSRKILVATADKTMRSYDTTPPNPQPAEPPDRSAAQVFTGHTDQISAIRVINNGAQVLTAAHDGTIRDWAVAGTSYRLTLTGHGSQVYDVEFSPNGEFVASASDDKTVRLWNVSNGKVVRTLSTQQLSVYGVAFTPDGTSVITGGGDKTVRLIRVSDATELRRYEGAEYALYSVDVSPDGQFVVAAGMGLGKHRPIFVWNLESGELVHQLTAHEDDVYQVAFNKTGEQLLSVGYAGAVRIWNWREEKVQFETQLPHILYSGAWTPDGRRVVVGSNNSAAYLIAPGPTSKGSE